MSDRLIDLIFLAIAAAIPVVVPMLIVLLYQALSAIRDARIRGVALDAVRAAQQMIPETSDRYAWVAAEVARRYPSLKADKVRVLIEAAVHQVKAAQPAALPVVGEIVTRDIDPADEDQ